MIAMGMNSWARGEPLRRFELADPTPGPGEVAVAISHCGVNPVDWKMRESGPLRLAARLVSLVRGPKPPVVVGVDFAGTVRAVGAGVTAVEVGARVVGACDFSRGQRGSLADAAVVRADQLARLPDTVASEVAACLPVAGVTALLALCDYRPIGPGGRVLVIGASGGVGQFAVQIARRTLGAAHVVGVCSARNADLVAALGAHQVIAYDKEDPIVQARALGPFDVVVDGVGTWPGAACRALVAPAGRHVMVAGDSPSSMVQIAVPPFRSRAILGRPTAVRLERLVAAVAAGEVEVPIAARMALSQAESAHALSKSGRVVGKIVLDTAG